MGHDGGSQRCYDFHLALFFKNLNPNRVDLTFKSRSTDASPTRKPRIDS